MGFLHVMFDLSQKWRTCPVENICWCTFPLLLNCNYSTFLDNKLTRCHMHWMVGKRKYFTLLVIVFACSQLFITKSSLLLFAWDGNTLFSLYMVCIWKGVSLIEDCAQVKCCYKTKVCEAFTLMCIWFMESMFYN
jgi:hypothetical protein